MSETRRRGGGRPSRYDWDDKKDICYKLYVEEGRSVPFIVGHFAQLFNVDESELPAGEYQLLDHTPSPYLAFRLIPTSYRKRLFHHNFRKWGFPHRRIPPNPDDEAEVLARFQELWQQSLSMKEIHEQLGEDGWEMNHYAFKKLRRKLGVTGRMEGGFSGQMPRGSAGKRKRTAEDNEIESDEQRAPTQGSALGQQDVAPGFVQGLSGPVPALTPEEQNRRAQRLAQIQLESDQNLSTRKRRRRIRGLGHLPPDAPGSQPRYGSETSLDECKAFLSLDNPTYIIVRNEFFAICEANDIDRKVTALSDGRWQNAKDQLIRENLHLSAVMNHLQSDLEAKDIALDCICQDVMKRLRNMAKKISMADANRALGLNPTSSKELRRTLYIILDQDHFTTRLACGDEHWKELMQKWYPTSPVLQQAMASNDEHKARCVAVLARDAAKRYVDDGIRRDPSKRQRNSSGKHYGPGPGAAKFRVDGLVKTSVRNQRELSKSKGGSAGPETTVPNLPVVAASSMTTAPTRPIHRPPGPTPAAQTPAVNYSSPDPVLAALYMPQVNHMPPQQLQNQQPPPPAQVAQRAQFQPQAQVQMQASAALASIPTYFRLAPGSSPIGNHPRMWLGKLASRSVEALRTAATSKPGMAQMVKAYGIIKKADGSEDSYPIDSDDELEVYMDEAGEKATFLVTLQGGYT